MCWRCSHFCSWKQQFLHQFLWVEKTIFAPEIADCLWYHDRYDMFVALWKVWYDTFDWASTLRHCMPKWFGCQQGIYEKREASLTVTVIVGCNVKAGYVESTETYNHCRACLRCYAIGWDVCVMWRLGLPCCVGSGMSGILCREASCGHVVWNCERRVWSGIV